MGSQRSNAFEHLLERYLCYSLLVLSIISGCNRKAKKDAGPPPYVWPENIQVAELVFDKGLKPGWQSWGWGKRNDSESALLSLDLSNGGGWVLVHPNLRGSFEGLLFRYLPYDGFGNSLLVHLEGPNPSDLRHVTVVPPFAKPIKDGWIDVYIPMGRLNPLGVEFDRIVFTTSDSVAPGWIRLDSVALSAGQTTPMRKSVTRAVESHTLDCSLPGLPINPMIFGIALDFMHDARDKHQWLLGATARRWGGNPSSRYNWKLGNAWNAGSDWFFENVNYTGRADYSYRVFLEDNDSRHVMTALTVPIIGWVAKDTRSISFARSKFPHQASFDPGRAEAGNGISQQGTKLKPLNPTETSIAASPDFIRQWVEAIRKEDKALGRRRVRQYILDNEPGIWNSTHRDVHPDPLTYDELVDRTIRYGSAIRQADPDAKIAGPAEWGWSNYFYSGKDLAVGVTLRSDRRSHDDVPLISYYLSALREHELKTHERVLDLLDLHFYPQGKGVYSDNDDSETAELRLRQTQSLWNPDYRDESWIADNIRLLPRMKEWIEGFYPGLGISIGEWNFGAEKHMSGGLAVAEVLGRFAQQGVTSAFYWTYPPPNSPAYWAFLAYRNFDGHGGHFQDYSVPIKSAKDLSLFASRDSTGRHWVLIALNLNFKQTAPVELDLNRCAKSTQAMSYAYSGGPDGFVRSAVPTGESHKLALSLQPYSITVLDILFENGNMTNQVQP